MKGFHCGSPFFTIASRCNFLKFHVVYILYIQQNHYITSSYFQSAGKSTDLTLIFTLKSSLFFVQHQRIYVQLKIRDEYLEGKLTKWGVKKKKWWGNMLTGSYKIWHLVLDSPTSFHVRELCGNTLGKILRLRGFFFSTYTNIQREKIFSRCFSFLLIQL